MSQLLFEQLILSELVHTRHSLHPFKEQYRIAENSQTKRFRQKAKKKTTTKINKTFTFHLN